MLEEVRKAIDQITAGNVILYPTDTIWGIGCDSTSEAAVEKIYTIKQRSDTKSMLVLMKDIPMLERFIERIPEKALEILENTGKPTTIVYPGAKNLARNLIAPDGTLGVRIPSDPFCQRLIEGIGKPLVSTSANVSGDPSPSLFHEIDLKIREKVDHIVDWRQAETRKAEASRILKISQEGEVIILRP